MSRDETILSDIVRAARLVLEFKQGMDKATFLKDIKTQSAVLHQLIVMGKMIGSGMHIDLQERSSNESYGKGNPFVLEIVHDGSIQTMCSLSQVRHRLKLGQ